MDWKTLLIVFVLVSSLKVLLIPSYRSTDFEVHRNWLAITHSLPLNEWYFSEVSQWTLDYPPFFAFFEYLLSHIAFAVDPKICEINNLNYASESVVYFQRGTVIASDFFLLTAVWRFAESSGANSSKSLSILLMVALNAGLLLVDHIHFQYNGILLSLLVLTLDFAFRKNHVAMAVTFSALILSKHLFLPLAPLFACYLIATFCFLEVPTNDQRPLSESSPSIKRSVLRDDIKWVFSPLRFLLLVSIAALFLVIGFGPFLYAARSFSKQGDEAEGLELMRAQLVQIAHRLFPFQRGLVHAYWAPNVWAVYCGIDKLISFTLRQYFPHLLPPQLLLLQQRNGISSTSGLVGDFNFDILPQIPTRVTILLLLGSMIPALTWIWRKPTPVLLLRCTVYCSLSMFIFGYHIHEKAILLPIIVCSLFGCQRAADAELLVTLSVAGIFAILPLFLNRQEAPIKWSIFIAFMLCQWSYLNRSVSISSWSKRRIIGVFVLIALGGIFTEIVHPAVFFRTDTKEVLMPFLPLMTTSLLSAVVLCFYAWPLSAKLCVDFA